MLCHGLPPSLFNALLDDELMDLGHGAEAALLAF
jgi:hypothetical protein